MATQTALLVKVKNHELEALGMSKVLLSQISALDDLFDAAYNICCPKPYDQENRRDLIRKFNAIAKELYGEACPVVTEFGSFLMNMFSSDSDLDLSINFDNSPVDLSKEDKIKTLRKFSKKFRKLQSRWLVKNVLLIPARVPVLKVTDCGTNIECDFSVENRDGIARSHIIFLIATIDERFRKLSIMLKAWAKTQDINSSQDGTLNSISLILLAAFHLQGAKPPILPPFSALLRDGCDPLAVQKNVAPFVNYGQKNKESVVQLFVTLLIRLNSVKKQWAKGLCASVYEGSWIHKIFQLKKAIAGSISVEDFMDQSQNVARAILPKKVSNINESIEKSLSQIQDYLDKKIEARELEKLLFGSCSPQKTKHVITNNRVLHDPTKKANSASKGIKGQGDRDEPSVLHAPDPIKKMRPGGVTTHDPYRYMHRAEGMRRHGTGYFGHPFAGHECSSSSRSFPQISPSLPHIPHGPSPYSALGWHPAPPQPQYVASFPQQGNPMGPYYFEQVNHNPYQFPEAPYPSRERNWSDQPYETPRGVHQPPFYW